MFVVKNSTKEQIVIDGLGVLAPGEERTFTDAEVEWYETLRGIKLEQDNLPKGAKLDKTTKKVVEDKKAEDK